MPDYHCMRYTLLMKGEVIPHRKQHRLPRTLYASPGAYFITICTHERHCTLCQINSDTFVETALGRLAQQCWLDLPAYWARLALDAFVVMPNHVHGIVVITTPREGRTSAAPTDEPPLPAPSLPQVVQAYKAAVTRRALASRIALGQRIWQRGYYDHVIRDEHDLNRIREYIFSNPLAWALDRENPLHTALHPFYAWLEEQSAALRPRP